MTVDGGNMVVDDEGGQLDQWAVYLSKSSSWFYKYAAHVVFSESESYQPPAFGNQGCWYFLDSEGDRYSLYVILQGNHVVNYNSKKPDIVEIAQHVQVTPFCPDVPW
jgi:hypothetical protein